MRFKPTYLLDYEKLATFIIKEVKIEKLNRTEIDQCLVFIEEALQRKWPSKKNVNFLAKKAQLVKRLADLNKTAPEEKHS